MMTEEQTQRAIENDEIVLKHCEIVWDSLMEATKDFSPSRRYIIFARVTGYMVANVYFDVVKHAIEDAQEFQREPKND